MRTEFKDVVHFYTGSKMLSTFMDMPATIENIIGVIRNNPDECIVVFEMEDDQCRSTSDLSHPENDDKPILYPLSAMTDAHKLEIFQMYNKSKLSAATYEMQAQLSKKLCEWHYNVFCLEADQFIDPASLPEDPYKS